MFPYGTLVNSLAIIAGGVLGLLLGRRIPEKIKTLVYQALGLAVIVLGLKMALGFDHFLIIVFSLMIGGVCGEAIGVEDRLAGLGELIKDRLKNKDGLFSEGLVTASLMYCIGSMAIVGAFDEGLRGDPSLLFSKAALDGFASLALASTYGLGVLFSSIPVFLYQGSLTLFASFFQEFLPDPLVAELTALGGLLILGIGLNMLEVIKIKIGNLLPSLLVLLFLVKLFG